jgi:hypothetical protein
MSYKIRQEKRPHVLILQEMTIYDMTKNLK